MTSVLGRVRKPAHDVSGVLAAARRVFPFFLLISAQIKGFGFRRKVPQNQTLSVPVRKVTTAPARVVRHVLSTRPVALALELWRRVSSLPGDTALWVREKSWGEQSCLGSSGPLTFRS